MRITVVLTTSDPQAISAALRALDDAIVAVKAVDPNVTLRVETSRD